VNHARRSEARPIDLSSSPQASRQASRKSRNSGWSGELKFWWVNDGNNHQSALIRHETRGHTSTLGSSLALLSLSRSEALKLAIGQEIDAGGMQHEWVEGGLTSLAGLILEALVPRDPASVSSADAGSSSLDRSVVVVVGSSPALGEKEESKPTVHLS
jgi:hypothetical protein